MLCSTLYLYLTGSIHKRGGHKIFRAHGALTNTRTHGTPKGLNSSRLLCYTAQCAQMSEYAFRLMINQACSNTTKNIKCYEFIMTGCHLPPEELTDYRGHRFCVYVREPFRSAHCHVPACALDGAESTLHFRLLR